MCFFLLPLLLALSLLLKPPWDELQARAWTTIKWKLHIGYRNKINLITCKGMKNYAKNCVLNSTLPFALRPELQRNKGTVRGCSDLLKDTLCCEKSKHYADWVGEQTCSTTGKLLTKTFPAFRTPLATRRWVAAIGPPNPTSPLSAEMTKALIRCVH